MSKGLCCLNLVSQVVHLEVSKKFSQMVARARDPSIKLLHNYFFQVRKLSPNAEWEWYASWWHDNEEELWKSLWPLTSTEIKVLFFDFFYHKLVVLSVVNLVVFKTPLQWGENTPKATPPTPPPFIKFPQFCDFSARKASLWETKASVNFWRQDELQTC